MPRVWEKLYAGIRPSSSRRPASSKARRSTPRPIGDRATEHETCRVAARRCASCSASTQARSRPSPAPRRIPVEILQFFRALGVPLSEIYGMSESSGPMTWDAVEVRVGTVGPRDPGLRGQARRRRRGPLPRRQRLPRLPQRSREDRRGARRRRLAAHRRHRQVRRRRLPQDRRPQEGADHHRRRQEHLTRQPRSRAQGVPAHRPGVRDRRRPAVRLGAARARPRGGAGVGASSTGSRARPLAELAENPDVRAEIERRSPRRTSGSTMSSR